MWFDGGGSLGVPSNDPFKDFDFDLDNFIFGPEDFGEGLAKWRSYLVILEGYPLALRDVV